MVQLAQPVIPRNVTPRMSTTFVSAMLLFMSVMMVPTVSVKMDTSIMLMFVQHVLQVAKLVVLPMIVQHVRVILLLWGDFVNALVLKIGLIPPTFLVNSAAIHCHSVLHAINQMFARLAMQSYIELLKLENANVNLNILKIKVFVLHVLLLVVWNAAQPMSVPSVILPDTGKMTQQLKNANV